MKKSILLLMLLAIVFGCKTTPEKNVEETAIETTTDGKVLLRLKPQKGEEQNMKMLMSTAAEGINMTMAMEWNMKVIDINENQYSYEMDFTKVNMDMDMMGQTMSYDSSKEPDNEMAKAMETNMKPLLDGVAKLIMNQMGEVKSVDWGDMAAAFQGQEPDMSGMNLALPKEAVGEGDSWETTREIPNAPNTTMSMKMTVNKITTDDVIVDLEGELGGMAPGKISGQYQIDKKTSFTKTGNMKIDMDVAGKTTTVNTTFKQI